MRLVKERIAQRFMVMLDRLVLVRPSQHGDNVRSSALVDKPPSGTWPRTDSRMEGRTATRMEMVHMLSRHMSRREFLGQAAAMGGASLLVAAGTTPVRAVEGGKPTDAFEVNKRLWRGVNIIGYDPLWKSHEKGRFKEQHFRLIKEAGFNHVRINLHPWRDGKVDALHQLAADWLETLDWAVRQALDNELLVILDLHEFQAMGLDPQGNRERFLATWRQLAEHCREASADVLFEILNEPNKTLTPELWNEYLGESLKLIRATNPTRTVVVGPAFWNSIDYLEKLSLPTDDRNLIATVHYYKPMAFTHQGAAGPTRKTKSGFLGTARRRNARRSSVTSTELKPGARSRTDHSTWASSVPTIRPICRRGHATSASSPEMPSSAAGAGATGSSTATSSYST